MGMVYYFVDRKSKTYYHIGKFGKWFLFDEYYLQQFESIRDVNEIKSILKMHVYYPVDVGSWEDKLIDRISSDIVDHFGGAKTNDIRIISDDMNDIDVVRALCYTCVGTALYDKGSKEYNEQVMSEAECANEDWGWYMQNSSTES